MISKTGYAITENILSLSECNNLIDTLSSHLPNRGRAGSRHLMSSSIIENLAKDSRLMSMAQTTLGKNAVPFRATLFEKSGQANWLVVWHQDTALPLQSHNDSKEWGPWSQKTGILYAHAPSWALNRIMALRVHLDASTRENGSLKVIPRSHLAGVLSDEEVFQIAKKQEVKECLVGKGGIVVMRPLLIHSSSKAQIDKPRRVIHIEYADSLQLTENIRLAVA